MEVSDIVRMQKGAVDGGQGYEPDLHVKTEFMHMDHMIDLKKRKMEIIMSIGSVMFRYDHMIDLKKRIRWNSCQSILGSVMVERKFTIITMAYCNSYCKVEISKSLCCSKHNLKSSLPWKNFLRIPEEMIF